MWALDGYVDPALDVAELTAEGLRDQNAFRLRDAEALAGAALWAKRRLGADATREMLAADKKVCRQILHKMHQLRALWLSDNWKAAPLVHTSMAEPKGDAGVVWERFAEDQLVVVAAQIALVATWAAMSPKADVRWAKQRMLLLERERYLWRDIAGVG